MSKPHKLASKDRGLTAADRRRVDMAEHTIEHALILGDPVARAKVADRLYYVINTILHGFTTEEALKEITHAETT